MRSAAIAAALLLYLLPNQRAPFRSAVEEVRVDVLVTEGRRSVTGLSAANFELRDSGVVQTIENVEVSEQPFSVLLALDTSSSMEGASLRQLRDGATAAVEALKPGDRASIVTFNEAIARATPWTGDRALLGATIDRLRAAGTTSLYDAATAAMLQRDPQPGRRNLLIVFTDGDDTSSWLPDSVAYDLAARTDVVVYGITTDVGPPSRDTALQWRSGIRLSPQGHIVSSTGFLAKLAGLTGGQHLRSMSADLRRTFAQIVAEFRTRYVLWYRPKDVPAAGWHPIVVRLRASHGHVTARRGYER
jgi:VWFA-related protein